jgi:trehalose/maltose hydrolase-like predicted phosphorylase
VPSAARARRRSVALLGLLLLAAGCPRPAEEPPEQAPSAARPVDAAATGAFARTDPWLLTTTDRNAARGNRGIFLGNGYLGATFGPDGGGGVGPDARCFVAGVYDAAENLAPIPAWNRLDLPAEAARGDYQQTLDMKRGLLVTRSGGVTVTSFVSRADPRLAVIRVEGGAPPPEATPPAVASPDTGGVGNGGRGYTLRDEKLGVVVRVRESDEGSGGWTRFVSVARSGEPAPPRFPPRRFEDALAEHTAAWARRWDGRDIVIEGDPEAQQLVHKLLFDLIQSARPGGDDSVPPETWSGDFYKGHIFWDAEVWVFPALLAQHPDLARCILDYRFRHLDEAKRRAKAQGLQGADFPWESAATGREVAPGGFSQGRHVTAGVSWAHWQYWLATGDRAWLRARGWPVLSAVADYWASRARKNPATGKYDVRGVFGPDELKGRVDNNTYTNALARYCLRAAGAAARAVGERANPRWAEVADKIALPFDAANRRYLARENDDGRRTKQADGELVLYPAALPMDAQTAANTFDFHAARPIRNGPAMTASIHALLAARLGRASEAERYFRDAYRPFVRGPFLLFSEKRSLDRCVFATGAGGVLQSVFYGFGRLDWEDFGPAAEGRKEIRAALPASWTRLTITGIRHRGRTFTHTVLPGGRPERETGREPH